MKLRARRCRIKVTSPRRVRDQAPRRCNVCDECFRPRTHFDRYCSSCKKDSELLKFSEWLPGLDESFAELVSA